MFDPVFFGSAVALSRVSPVMLGDELCLGARGRTYRPPARSHFQMMPSVPDAPPIADASRRALRRAVESELVRHRDGGVGLVVPPPGDEYDCSSRHDFPDEHNRPLPVAPE